LFEKGRLKINERKVVIKKGDSWKDKYEVFPDVLYRGIKCKPAGGA
jgi:hypothetical protein